MAFTVIISSSFGELFQRFGHPRWVRLWQHKGTEERRHHPRGRKHLPRRDRKLFDVPPPHWGSSGLGVANSTCNYFMIVIVKCKTMICVTNSNCNYSTIVIVKCKTMICVTNSNCNYFMIVIVKCETMICVTNSNCNYSTIVNFSHS